MSNPNVHILVVEDNVAIQFVINKMLSKRGYRVTCVNDGLKALKLQKENPVDLIFMDVSMPIMDGLTSTREIRRIQTPCAAVPIIALTAHHLTEQKAECIAAGMDDFLIKPAKAADLVAKINRWVTPIQ